MDEEIDDVGDIEMTESEKCVEIRDCDPAKLTAREKADGLEILRKGPSYLYTAE